MSLAFVQSEWPMIRPASGPPMTPAMANEVMNRPLMRERFALGNQ
jgi:hypothetical protein